MSAIKTSDRLAGSVVWHVSLLMLWAVCGMGGPMMRVLHSASVGTPLLLNGDFEQGTDQGMSRWQAAPQGYRVGVGEGRNGSRALAGDNPKGEGWVGASQTVLLNRTNIAPLAVRGWSKAENVSGSADSDYSLYADLVYADGTTLWGQTVNFPCGTRDWQLRSFVILPEKPVKSLTLHCLFRRHSGKVWFDDVAVEEIDAPAGTTLFQGVPVALERVPLPREGSTETVATRDGLSLTLRGERVASVQIQKKELAVDAPSGFLVRDVAADSDFYGFVGRSCPELGLRLEANSTAQSNHIVIQGRLSDTTKRDRAITLVFALPLDAVGWRWGDDIRRERTIAGQTEYANATAVRWGATGTMSLYPLAAVLNDHQGLAIGLDMAQPAQYRLGYHARTRQLFIAFDFGLVPETQRFPGGADFRFVIYQFDPSWGFRAAFEKLTAIFPDYFAVRSTDQGIWMPFTDISKVQGWQDFGFKYHEGDNNVAFDDAHGILSFRYTEPMTWWMPMGQSIPRTPAEALKVRDTLAASANERSQRLARITQFAAMRDETGQPCLLFRDEPWSQGAVWSLNPNPYLPALTNGIPGVDSSANANRGTSARGDTLVNAGTVHWNEALKERLYGAAAKGHLDGEYLDSLEGYVTADLNFDRDHFRATTVPLTFDRDTKKPALCKGLAVFEFTKWMAEDVHRMGKLMFANGVPYRFTFLCPWLDVMGTETDWQRNGQYRPVPDAQMCLWRTMSGPKPYLLLMNTDYNTFTSDRVEKYFQRCLFYGMFPSMFSHNAADNPYWQNPNWYNRDRALFVKYQPVIKQVAEAGWQPVTGARSINPQILVEKFGSSASGPVYFTVYNDTAVPQTGTLVIENTTLKTSALTNARELLSQLTLMVRDRACPLSLQSGEVKVIQVTRP